jgi:hypothetical protein
MGKKLFPVLPRAAGETSLPGASECCIPGQLVLVWDQLSQRCFLVDTGATFLVFPHSSDGPLCGPALAGAAGRTVPCWGEKQFKLSFDGKHFSWLNIIGVDFLHHYGLLVDPAGNRLVDRRTLQSLCSSPLGVSQPAAAPSTGLSLVRSGPKFFVLEV